MSWRIWMTTCLLAAVVGVLAGVVVVGVSATSGRPAVAGTGLPVPGERPSAATGTRAAGTLAARTVPRSILPAARHAKAAEPEKRAKPEKPAKAKDSGKSGKSGKSDHGDKRGGHSGD
jgi:hypothetical protein